MASSYSPASGAEATESSSGHRRRTSRASLNVHLDGHSRTQLGLTSSPTKQVQLGTTPFIEEDDRDPMSLDHSPSPQRDGGWSSPGLTTPFEDTKGARIRGVSPNMNGGHGVTWASAKANSERVNGYPRYQSQNQGFFSRVRKMSMSLPLFAHGGQEDRYAEKEKLGRGRQGRDGGRMAWSDFPRRIGLLLSRRRKYLALLIFGIFLALWWFNAGECMQDLRKWIMLTRVPSHHLLVSKNLVARRRLKIRHHSRRKSRRRRDGVEGRQGVGH